MATTSSIYDLERHKRVLQGAANPYLAASEEALKRLQEGVSGVYSDTQFKQIAEYYKKPVLQQATERQQGLSNQMRAAGLFDSGAHTQKLLQDFQDTERQLAQNIDVPLLMEQFRQKEATAQANINQAAALGLQGYQAYQTGAQQALQEEAARASYTGQWVGRGTIQAQAQAFQQQLLLRQQELDETNAAITRALQQAAAIGSYVDPQTGQALETLQAKAQQVQTDLAFRSQALQEKEQAEASQVRQAGVGLSGAQLAEQQRQFDATTQQRAGEFASQMRLSTDQFLEAKRQFDAGQQMTNAQLAESIRQFNEELAQRENQFSQQLGLSQAQLIEQQRQFNVQMDQTAGQFAAQFGLTTEQFYEAKRQFDAGYTLESRQLATGIEQFNAGLVEQRRQFDATVGQREGEFAQQMGLSQTQFQEAIRQYNLGRTDQLLQLDREYGLQQGQLSESIRQFNSELSQRQVEFGAQIGLSQAQLIEQQRQFDVQTAQREGEFAQQMGLSQTQFQEMRRQFDTQTEQAAIELGLSRSQFEEAKRQFDAGYTLENTQVAEGIRQFNVQTQQRAVEFGQQYGLSVTQVQESIRQFNADLSQRQTEQAQQYGLSQVQLAEQQRQFDVATQQTATQFAANLGLDTAQFTETQRQFNMQAAQSASQFAAQLGLETSKYRETMRQFDAGQAQRIEEFRSQYGLTKEQFYEAKRQFDAGMTLDNAQVAEGMRQFNLQLAQRSVEYAGQLGLSQQEFDETRRQFDAAQTQAASQFASQLGLSTNQFIETSRQFDVEVRLQQEKQQQEYTLGQQQTTIQRDLANLQVRIEEADRTGDLAGKATLQAQEQKLQERLAVASATGYLYHGTLDTGGLTGLSANQISNYQQQIAKGDAAARGELEALIKERFVAVVGRSPTGTELNELVFNRKIQPPSVQTLEGRQMALQESSTSFQQTLAQAEITGYLEDKPILAREVQAAQDALSKASLTGKITVDGAVLETLQAQLQTLQGNIQKAELTGKLENKDTLQKTLQDAQIGLERLRLSSASQQFFTEQTGLIGAGGKITAAQLGIDLSNPDKGQVEELLRASLQAANLPVTAERMAALLRNEGVDTGGQLTLAAVGQATQVALQTRTQQLQQEAQKNAAALEGARLSGSYQNQLTLEAKQQAVEAELSRLQLSMQQTQFLTGVTGKVGGEKGTVRAADLGVDVSGVYDAAGKLNMERFFEVAEVLGPALGAIGLDINEAQMMTLMKGLSVSGVDASTLAAKELATRVAYNVRQQQLVTQSQANAAALEQARLTGNLGSIPTLEAKQQAVEAELSRLQLSTQTQQFYAELTGKIGVGGQLDAQGLGVDLTNPNKTMVREQLTKALQTLGVTATPNQLTYLEAGHPIATDSQRSLEAITLAQTQAATVAQQQLEARKVKVQEDLANLEGLIQEADRTGDWGGKATLEQQKLTMTNEQFTIEMGLEKARLAVAQAQFYTTQTGRIGEGGIINAKQLGIDITNPNQAQLDSQIKLALQAANIADTSSNRYTIKRGYDLPTGGQLTLAAVDQATQAGLQGRSLDIEGARATVQQQAQDTVTKIAIAQQTGKIEVDGVSIETLQAKQFILERQLETADRTGQMMAQVGALDFGIDTSTYLSSTGAITQYAAYAAATTAIRAAFETAFGRPPLPTETTAIATGQTITTTVQTLAGQQLQTEEDWKNYQKTLEAASLTGTIKDPLSGQVVETLAKQAQTDLKSFQTAELTNQGTQIANAHTEFTAELTQRMQEFATASAQQWAQLTGKTAFAESIKAGDLGVSLTDSTQTAAQRDAALQQTFTARFGRAATLDQVAQLARGFPVSVQGVRTLTAQEMDATVANIYAQIDLSKKQFQQNATQYLAENARAWAQISGMGYGNSELKVSDLGVDLADTTMTAAAKDTAIKAAFKSLTGKEVTAEQLLYLGRGLSITVTGSPTLAAKQLAAEVSAQNLGRMADLSKFSREMDLQEDQFEQAVTESDRLYGLQAQEMAKKYQLDAQNFALAKMELDGRITGKLNISGTLSAKDMGIDLSLLPTQISASMLGFDVSSLYEGKIGESRLKDPTFAAYSTMANGIMDALRAQGIDPYSLLRPGWPLINEIMWGREIKSDVVAKGMLTSVYQALQGKALTTGELSTLMSGGKVSVATLDTLEARQWAAAMTDTANKYDLDVQQFEQASKEFDLSYKLNDRNMWAEITGQAIGLEGGVTTGEVQETVAYEQYLQAKASFDENERKRETIWETMLKTARTTVSAEYFTLQSLQNGGVLPAKFTLTAADFGVDASGTYDANGNITSAGWDKFYTLANAAGKYGVPLDYNQLITLLHTGEIMSSKPTPTILKTLLDAHFGTVQPAGSYQLLATGGQVKLNMADWTTTDQVNLANFVNQHTMSVAPKGPSGWLGLGQIVGTVVAAAVSK